VTITPEPRHRLPGRTVQVAGGLAGAAAVSMMVALYAAGGAPERDVLGLVDPGRTVLWSVPMFRLLADLAMVACVGALLAATVLLPSPDGRLGFRGRRAVQDAALVAAVWALAALGGTAVTAAVSLAEALSELPSRLDEAADLPQVRALAVSAALAASVAAVVSGARTRRFAAVGLVIAAGALSAPLFTGHAWTDDYAEVATASRILHVAGAAAWIGGLAALVRYGRGSGPALPIAVARFSRLALGCAIAVGLSGAVVALIHLAGAGGGLGDAIEALTTTGYGGVVLVKLGAFALLVAAGRWHRRRNLSRLTDRSGAFWFLVAVELVIMGVAVGLAVALTRTP
jgi:putative copper export protein